jgi:hypothetical protein
MFVLTCMNTLQNLKSCIHNMYVYTLKDAINNAVPGSELGTLLHSMERVKRVINFILIGAYRYPGLSTDSIPEAVWNEYRAFTSVDIFSGKHWELEQRLYFEDDKWSVAKAKTVKLKLHGPAFPLDFMLRVSPEIRTCLKLERAS